MRLPRKRKATHKYIMYFNDYVIGDVIQDVSAMSLPSLREPEVDITYEIVEGSSIRGRDKLFRSDGFSYTINTMNSKKGNTL